MAPANMCAVCGMSIHSRDHEIYCVNNKPSKTSEPVVSQSARMVGWGED